METYPVKLLFGPEPIQIVTNPARSTVEGLAVASETDQPPLDLPVARFKLLQQPGQGNDTAGIVSMDAADRDQCGSVYLLTPGAHHLGISVSTPTHRLLCISSSGYCPASPTYRPCLCNFRALGPADSGAGHESQDHSILMDWHKAGQAVLTMEC